MKTNKPWIDPNNLNNTQKLLIALGAFCILVITFIIVVPPNPIQAQNASTNHYNMTGGMVIVSPGHPTNEQEFNDLINRTGDP
jgi:hypothetical protein